MELLYLAVQADIENKIHLGIWKENEQIPSERILAEQYGVSRTVIRDALKGLAGKNLIVNRIGKGNYVSRPQEADVVDLMGSAIEWSNIPVPQIINAREDMELLIAKYSVYMITETGISHLEELIQQMDHAIYDMGKFSVLDGQFHMYFAQTSGNQVLKIFERALNMVVDRKIIYGGTVKTRQNAQVEHRMMVRALEEHSLSDLQIAIKRHIACIRAQIFQSEKRKTESAKKRIPKEERNYKTTV
jgi:GntR family transcriptional repressor for pyruvate dehydrogenase complex